MDTAALRIPNGERGIPPIEQLLGVSDVQIAACLHSDRPQHFPPSGKVEALFSWARLDSMLNSHPPKSLTFLRMAREGAALNPSEYQDAWQRPWRNDVQEQRWNTPRMMAMIQGGVTLALYWADELDEGLSSLAESIEEVIRGFVQINLYAVAGADPGFLPHTDHHPILVLQIAGDKLWKLPGEEFLLTPGSMLFLPKEYVHEVYPTGKASLHLTVGMFPGFGSPSRPYFDFARMFAGQ